MNSYSKSPELDQISDTAMQLRSEFEGREYDEALVLDRIMAHYRKTNETKRNTKLRKAIGNCLMNNFPNECCDVATVMLKERLGFGDIVFGVFYISPGKYFRHVFLDVGENNIVDITADQFGGPEVYVGKYMLPWREYPYTPSIFHKNSRNQFPEPALDFSKLLNHSATEANIAVV